MNKAAAPTSTVEDYLKCILLHQEREVAERVSMGQIAAGLVVAPGTVTAMMKALAESGLVDYEPYSGVRLTASGQRLAAHVLRRHRLIELFLVRVMHFDWSEVHAEAELLEHAVSDRLIERIDAMLGSPAVDPHGDPIPDARGVVAEFEQTSLLGCVEGAAMRVTRVGDQSAEFLRLIERGGLMPGTPVRVIDHDALADRLELDVGDPPRRTSLGPKAAAKIFVEPAEE